MTSSESRCTSVTSHQAQAHPPTMVRFFVEPQHPPERNQLEVCVIRVEIQLDIKLFAKLIECRERERKLDREIDGWRMCV